MIPFRTMRRDEQTFTHVDDKGKNIHIAVTRMIAWVKANKTAKDIQMGPVDPGRAQRWLNEGRATVDRCLELLTKDKLDPIIFCHTGTYTNGRPDVYLADGYHRYCLCGMAGKEFVPCFFLMKREWGQFQITGVPLKLSQEDVLNLPDVKRDY